MDKYAAAVADARKHWPTGQLIVIRIDDDVLAGPLEHVYMMSTQRTVIQVLGIENG